MVVVEGVVVVVVLVLVVVEGVEEEEGLAGITVDFGQSKTFNQRILILTGDVAPGDWSVPI